MPNSNAITGYSAEVQLRLIVDDHEYALSQIGPNCIVPRGTVTLPPCEADVVMHVDGHRRVWRVWLPDGVSPKSTFARTEQLAPVA